MENAIERYWEKRLADVKAALEDNGFRALVAHDREAARRMVIEDILEKAGARSIAWGGSLTFIETGLYELLKDVGGMEVIDTYDKRIPREEVLERRRQALMADLFFTGTNALTAGGKLVNLDMIGNRVAALAFGPRQVVVLAGRNKIVPGLEEAMTRIRDYAAPVNTRRLQKKTPCAATSKCSDCLSPERICNVWTITEKSFPPGRITVVLINEDLGF